MSNNSIHFLVNDLNHKLDIFKNDLNAIDDPKLNKEERKEKMDKLEKEINLIEKEMKTLKQEINKLKN